MVENQAFVNFSRHLTQKILSNVLISDFALRCPDPLLTEHLFEVGVVQANRKGIRWSCPTNRQSPPLETRMTSGLGLASMVLPLGSKVLEGDEAAFWVGKSWNPKFWDYASWVFIVVYIFLTWIQITILGWYVYFFPTIFHATIRNDVSNCQQIGDILQCLFASKNLCKFGSCI